MLTARGAGEGEGVPGLFPALLCPAEYSPGSFDSWVPGRQGWGRGGIVDKGSSEGMSSRSRSSLQLPGLMLSGLCDSRSAG